MSKSTEQYTKDYSNIENVPYRTRLALWFILVAIKLLEPWQYAHQFESDIKELQDMLRGKPNENKN